MAEIETYRELIDFLRPILPAVAFERLTTGELQAMKMTVDRASAATIVQVHDSPDLQVSLAERVSGGYYSRDPVSVTAHWEAGYTKLEYGDGSTRIVESADSVAFRALSALIRRTHSTGEIPMPEQKLSLTIGGKIFFEVEGTPAYGIGEIITLDDGRLFRVDQHEILTRVTGEIVDEGEWVE